MFSFTCSSIILLATVTLALGLFGGGRNDIYPKLNQHAN